SERRYISWYLSKSQCDALANASGTGKTSAWDVAVWGAERTSAWVIASSEKPLVGIACARHEPPAETFCHRVHNDSTGGDDQTLQPCIAAANSPASTLPPESTTAALRPSSGSLPESSAASATAPPGSRTSLRCRNA